MYSSIAALWDHLTRPLRDTGDQQLADSSRFMASFMFAALGLMPPALLVFSTLDWSLARGIGIYGATTCLLIAYALARFARPGAAGLVLVFGSSAVLYVQAIAFNNEDSVHLLFYLTFLVAFAATFLRLYIVALLGLLHLFMALSLPAFVTGFTVMDMFKGPVYFNLVGVVFILMLTVHMQRRRRYADERLIASEYSYRLLAVEHEMQARWLEDILSASPDHIIVFDQAGRILYANEHVAQAFGRERGDLIHKTGQELGLPPEMAQPLHDFIARVFAGEDRLSIDISMALPHTTSDVQHFAFTVSPIRDAYGKVLAAVATRRDITQPKRMQQALEASRERYRIISELISDYAFAFRVENGAVNQLEWMTDSFRRVTGYAWDDIEAQGDIFKLYHPDDQEAVRSDVRRVCAGQVTVGEYRIRTAAGDERWVRVHRRPEADPTTGQIRRYYGVAQDITERRQTERQRVKLAAEREHMHVIQQFVLAVSHDFRNSLANIETSRYLLHRRLIEPTADEQMLAKSEAIRHNVKHLSEQLDNLSTVFSLKEPANDQVNVAALVQALARQNQRQAQEKGITLVEDIAPYLPAVRGSSSELAQAVQHLLNNALTYTPGQGRITLSVQHTGGEVHVTVADTGPGIDPEHLPHIFDLFYRADPARSMTAGGVGVGLSIVKLIVDAHGGRVEVNSEPGLGSSFTLCLPVTKGVPLPG